jgi:hypothetical protein
MRLAAAAVTLILLTGTAYAQPAMNLWGAGEKKLDPEAEARQQEIDRAYRAKIQGQKPAQAPSDPWGSVRASEAPQGKAQTGSKSR